MLIHEYQQALNGRFPRDINDSALKNNNELYLGINPASIRDFCRFLHRERNCALVSMFANDERAISQNCFAIFYVFAVKGGNSSASAFFIILKTLIPASHSEFDSIHLEVPAAHLYEREINDLFGITPSGHPDLRPFVLHENWPAGVFPLRKDFNCREKLPFQTDGGATKFTRVQGTGVYEIPVGPVHAGIIEPGHFRFSVAGEPIINLEAQLFYVHKGIEKLMEGKTIEQGFYIAERISGDETFANSLAYCLAVEKIAGITVSERVNFIRVILAEMERLVSHLGDLAGICVDVAYGFAAFQFRLLRGWTYQLIEEVSGSRFLRSANQPGGLRRDFITGNETKIRESLARIRKELAETVSIIKANSMFIDRIEHTGVLTTRAALDLNAVGPAGRASGVRRDLRKDFPYAAYDKLHIEVPAHNNGDVNCRMNVKIEECFTAMDLILEALEIMPKSGEIRAPILKLEPYRSALGYTEAPRGENIHWLMTGEDNTIFRYKVRTPSFCNWPALCQAVKGNIVPDFPLINKSFNLSYAGNDL
ncbi:MAG: NADH-quinone oxidoreductase subunit C [Firmicutes bacterium]|nr:NADH-quinone oxidoreductase subunit C [Bacillota bacterium]